MKTLKSFATIVAMLMCCITTSAQTLVDGIWYNFNSNGTASVTRGGKYTGAVTIPATVTYKSQTYNVTSVEDYAFYDCSDLTSVTIPNSVTSIGTGAFHSCYALVSVNIPDGLKRIEEDAFYYCCKLPSISIPNSVTSIGKCAFCGCFSLNSISIPSSVESIEQGAFYDVEAVEQISVDASNPIYDSRGNCNAIIETASNTLILGCRSTVVPNDVTSIGHSAFRGSKGLTSIVIPKKVTNIGDFSFYKCPNLQTVICKSTTPPTCGNDVFDSEVPSKSSLLVPITSLDAYKTTSPWSSFSNIEPSESGTCGTNLTWRLTANGELVIEGTGKMSNYSNYTSYAPWYNYRDFIEEIIIENGVTSIGSYAFNYCSSLTSITIPNSVTSIESDAFYGCSKLADVHITSIENWCNIKFGDYNANPLYNGGNLYLNGNLVTEITIPSNVTQIKDYAFYYSGVKITLQSTTPPVLKSTSAFDSNSCFVVPAAAYDDYCAAPYWAEIKTRITKDNMNVKNVALTANSNRSALETEIGEANLRYVTDLTISGTINSYDFMVMRNKMTLLRNLDLSEATIVANKYEHYTNYCTEDNKFPKYGLYNCKLNTLILPKNIESIGSYAIADNAQLRMLEMQKGVTTIGDYAFNSCSKLTHVDIPNSVTSIGSYAFNGCSILKSVEIQKGLVSIGNYCFASCSSLSSIMLPPSITSIGKYAFSGCYSLSEVHLPSSLRSIGDNAFNCGSKLKDVYVYVVEPIDIGQNTFTKSGNNFTSTLHAPKTSFWDYYYDTQWSQFLSFAEFDGTYDNFYLEGDKTLDNETGSLEGEDGKAPDAELGENSGIIVGGDVNQNLGDVDVEHDGENGGSIIVGGGGQVTFENLTFHINVQGGRWYFFCFPFDVRSEDIKCENGADWVFRYYDGEERANNGKGGWKNVTSDGNGNFLKAATGYIFQCSKNDVLTLTAKNGQIKKEKKYNELKEHVTQNMQDASWNFVGNPYLSYYEITQDDYSAPITVWDGKKYIAIRPGDENYTLAPFEAFFVQKPSGTNSVNYNPDNQKTYNQTKNNGNGNGNKARMAGHAGTERLLVNITLSDGKETDRTRVVFNEKAAMDYELECDASKFITEGVPQLYTLSTGNVMYAINERPMAQGCINLGFSVPAYGKYTIEGQRMDIGMLLMDNITGEVHDLSKGGYEFTSQAGTFNSRFTLVAKADATGINETENGEDADRTPLYNIKGQQVKTMEQGEIYIKNKVKVTKN